MKLANLSIAAILAASSFAIAQDAAPVDTDGDGMMSPEEVMAAFPDVNEDVFTAADTDGDGMLSMEEFAAAQEDGLIPAEEM
ncbi:EF-hand domain-containing protein [Maritimibacter dapengensis]|uniref:EF-hand domain-containing protein n=1 Tax=Maritimibacter dapengensis TaxID=2836868 RepID=A0ABS6T4X1_9RHOB|nr:EF-hand domain-containing protein [Maritimibacter dapengensis]MBV7380301.1 EF-hand domain-containing protein [Maritimibacter dapengensis]